MRIMVVDDEPANLKILDQALSSEHDVILCGGAKECLQHPDCDTADAYLLDVNMPGVDGFELCRTLRKNPTIGAKPILFLSALGTIDQKMEGYECGGDDYITKPYNIREVCHKVNLYIQRSKQISDTVKQKEIAEGVARVALKQSSEIGVIGQFVENSAGCHNYEALANLLIGTLKQFSLSGSIQIRVREEKIDICDTGWPSELEVRLLDAAKNKARIIEMGQRCILNDPKISILIRNLPEDKEVQGRLRDHLAILLTAAASRITAIEAELFLKRQQDNWVNNALGQVCSALVNVKTKFEEHDSQTTEIMDALMGDMEFGLASLGLSDEQESYFLALVDSSMQRLIKLYNSGMEIDQCFANVETDLKRIIGENNE